MKKISLLFLLLVLSLSLSAISKEELQQKIDARYKNLSTYQANVVQKNRYVGMNKELSFEGRFYFEGEKLLLSFHKPHIQRLYIVGKKGEIYDESSKTLFKSEIMPQFQRLNPIEILSTYWTKSKVSILKEDKSGVQLKLVPGSDPMFKDIEAKVSPSGVINELSYSDNSGNKVKYIFSEIKFNQSIDKGVWGYTYPKDTRIIQR